MTHEEILEKVRNCGVCVISWEEFHKLFPGRSLSEIERQFKTELYKAGYEKLYNPRGSSQDDQLMRFVDENHLCYRWIDDKPAFHLRGIDFSQYDAQQKAKKTAHGDTPPPASDGPDSTSGSAWPKR